MDFGIDQIDIKKKFIKKFGENVTIRIRFTAESCPPPIFKEISKVDIQLQTNSTSAAVPSAATNSEYAAVSQVELVVREEITANATENI